MKATTGMPVAVEPTAPPPAGGKERGTVAVPLGTVNIWRALYTATASETFNRLGRKILASYHQTV